MHEPERIESTKLGDSGLQIPKIGFGATALGDMPEVYGFRIDEDRAKATLRAIFAGPASLIDTAPGYRSGRSEQRIGAVIRERGGLPDGFIVSSKLERDLDTGRFDGAQARRSLEASRKALGLDHLHLLHLHDPEFAARLSEITGPGGALAELFAMKEEGLADAVGLAAGNVDIMMPILRDWDFDVMITHNRFTLVNRNATPMIDFARSKGVAILNAAPYNSGVLAKGSDAYPRFVYQDAGAAMLEPIRRIEAVCDRHGIPVGAAALQFSLRDARITSTICGVSEPAEIRLTLEWANWPIPDAAWQDLLALPFSMEDPEAFRWRG